MSAIYTSGAVSRKICYTICMGKKEHTYQVGTKHGRFTITVWYDSRDKAYLVRVPKIPEIVTFGKTLAEAKRMGVDALELYCDCIIDEGKIVVDDARKIIGQLPKSKAGVFSLQTA